MAGPPAPAPAPTTTVWGARSRVRRSARRPRADPVTARCTEKASMARASTTTAPQTR
ncbi:hypothetical protein [Ornithinimicrobium kibberense]|uniref:hypothetical protein n=1 Tax=Ornithinimicrobium kibberense TaxID=282060 RepID=UPI003611ECB3